MIPTKLLNEIIRRAEALKECQPSTFPPLSRDYHEQEIDWAVATLLGDKTSSQFRDEAADLAWDLRVAKDQIGDLERDIESLQAEIRGLEHDLAIANDR